MKITNYTFVRRYNGNLRVFLSKKFNSKTQLMLSKDINKERSFIFALRTFQKKVENWKKYKKKYIEKLNKLYGPIPAKAFPGRASILLNILKLNSKNISNIYEKNSSLKVGKYAPGTDIKIEKEKNFMSLKERKNYDKSCLAYFF